MNYTTLGNSTLQVSRVGFGCDPLGGHAWGRVDQAETSRAVRLAVERGVTLFDTADCYGVGVSEKLLGAALGKRRKEVVVATKFGVRIDRDGKTFFDNSRKWLDEALESSLRRLRTDYIDLYQVHYWDMNTPLDEVFEYLVEKRQAGKIRWYGVTNLDLHEQGVTTVPEGLASCSFEYSLVCRHYERQILSMTSNGAIGFLSWGSLGQGILSGKYGEKLQLEQSDRRNRPDYVNFHGDKLRQNLRLIKAMRQRLGLYPNMTLPQMAIRWVLDYLKPTAVLVGIKTCEQLEEIAGASEVSLTPEDVAFLERMTI